MRLDIVLDLNGPGVRFISLETQDEVVLPGCQRKSYRRLPGLFRAVDEDISSRRLAADENALGQRFELDLLVLCVPAFYLQRGLYRLIAFLLHFQAVARRRQIVETAGRLALAQNVARGAAQNRGCAYHIGDHVNRTASRCWDGVRAFVGVAAGGDWRVVVFQVIDA